MSDKTQLNAPCTSSLRVIECRVTGASHLRRGKECQDSTGTRTLPDGTVILSVADGHGSSSCPFSADGSRIAVELFLDTMEELYASARDELQSRLNDDDGRLALELWTKWENAVLRFHSENGREPVSDEPELTAEERSAIRHMYGTTLLGMLISHDTVFAFQLGDGDIVHVTPQKATPVVEGEKLLGVETYSMSSSGGWKKAVSALSTIPDSAPYMFMLTTDGFANSYATDDDFLNTCADYFRVLEEIGAEEFEANLESWLNETSEGGSGDDISMVICYSGAASKEGSQEAAAELEAQAPTGSENKEKSAGRKKKLSWKKLFSAFGRTPLAGRHKTKNHNRKKENP